VAAKPVSIGIVLVFHTPPSIAAAGAYQSLADRVVERNAKGEFIIPGSQLKGKLRHACEQLLRALGKEICSPPRAETMCPPGLGKPCLLCQVFGGPAYPSPLKFGDLVLDLGGKGLHPRQAAPSRRAMIGINRRRATVAEGRLFLVEAAPHFPTLRFANEEAITGTLDNFAQVRLLLAGLRLIPAWGGMKSRGLGWIGRKVQEGRMKVEVEVSALFDGNSVKVDDWQEVRELWSG